MSNDYKFREGTEFDLTFVVSNLSNSFPRRITTKIKNMHEEYEFDYYFKIEELRKMAKRVKEARPVPTIGKSYSSTKQSSHSDIIHTATVVWFDDKTVVYDLRVTNPNVESYGGRTERTTKPRERFEEIYLEE